MGVLADIIALQDRERQAANNAYSFNYLIDNQLKQAQIANLMSEVQNRPEQNMIANIMKGANLKQKGIETNDKNLYDLGDMVLKDSFGLPSSVNQYVNPVVASNMPPTPLSSNNKQPAQTENDLYNSSIETDWRGKPTAGAMKAKDELDLQKQRKEQEIKDTEKNKENADLEKKRLESEQSFAQDMLGSIGEVEKGIKYFGAMGNVPAGLLPLDYPRVNWRANLDKILSQNVLNTMKELKGQSKTGSTGFGQLSNKELGILMNASTVLKPGMSEEDAKRYLQEMKKPLEKIISNKNKYSDYKVGQEIVNKEGKKFVITGFAEDGEPLVDSVK